jgi:hypothetical protein
MNKACQQINICEIYFKIIIKTNKNMLLCNRYFKKVNVKYMSIYSLHIISKSHVYYVDIYQNIKIAWPFQSYGIDLLNEFFKQYRIDFYDCKDKLLVI